MLTGASLAEYCEKVYRAGWVYWYGTYGNKCTAALYIGKRDQYPSHYTEARAAAYQRDISEGRTCADCVGMIKAFFWTGGKFGEIPKYATGHCPDVSANGMIALCDECGPIGTMPDEPGLVVWRSGHIGVYVGNGYTVEMKGFAYDCQRNKLAAGSWTKWGKLPKEMIAYVGDEGTGNREQGTGELEGTGNREQGTGELEGTGNREQGTGIAEGNEGTGNREQGTGELEGTGNGEQGTGEAEGTGNGEQGTGMAEGVKKGDRGEAVKAMQKALLAWRPDCLPRYGADGDFGSETERALKAFQKEKGLPVTGICDDATRRALEAVEAEDMKVRVVGGSVNVRSGPGTAHPALGVVYKGDALPYGGEDRDVNGTPWHSVSYKGREGWLSGKYSEVVKG